MRRLEIKEDMRFPETGYHTRFRRLPHVLAVVVSGVSGEKLPADEAGDGGASRVSARGAAASPRLLLCLPQPQCDSPRRVGPLVSQSAGGQRADVGRRHVAAGGMPRLRAGAADRQRPGRIQADLHPRLRALRAGTVALHDDSGYWPPPGRQLGHRQGHSEATPPQALRPAPAQAGPSDRHRRDLHRPRLPLPHARARSGNGRDPVRRPGQKSREFAAFLASAAGRSGQVEAVAIDMSPAYLSAVEENLPAATVVFDHFHIIKLMNEKLTALRRDLHREAVDKRRQQVLKGTRWLLLKTPENLDPKKGEPKRLREALRLNESLATAYYLKEDLRQIWQQPSKFAARRKLIDWYQQAMASGVRILQEFARLLLARQDGILAWYDYPISTGPLEGTNNKIKTMQRQHYGLRDQEFFLLKLYQLHETKYALVG